MNFLDQPIDFLDFRGKYLLSFHKNKVSTGRTITFVCNNTERHCATRLAALQSELQMPPPDVYFHTFINSLCSFVDVI